MVKAYGTKSKCDGTKLKYMGQSVANIGIWLVYFNLLNKLYQNWILDTKHLKFGITSECNHINIKIKYWALCCFY